VGNDILPVICTAPSGSLSYGSREIACTTLRTFNALQIPTAQSVDWVYKKVDAQAKQQKASQQSSHSGEGLPVERRTIDLKLRSSLPDRPQYERCIAG
jgi:hypothetical protein